jgi:O-antigen/teichoic acid export membrane protein
MNIRRKMAHGVVWMVGFKVLERSLGVLSMLVLARLLVPADFGLVAMATSVIALLELFSAFGVDTALIQRADASRAHYDSAWTLNALAGFAIGTCLILMAIPVAAFYNEPRVKAVLCVLAAGAMIQGLENIGVVNFRKEMQFDKEFRFLLAKKVIGFAIIVPLAFAWRSYWALVAGIVLGRAAGVGLSYVLHPFRPRFSLAAAKDLLHVSKWLLTQNFISFLRERSPDFVIGRFAGPSALGVFSVAHEISNMPSTELVAPINRAILPAYVKLAQDLPALGREYLSVMAMIALVAVPAVAGVAATASFLVLLILGPAWVEVAILLQILAFFGITQVLQSNAYAAFLAIGQHQVFVKINGMHVAILLPLASFATVFYGVEGAAWAYVAAGTVVLPVNFIIITRFLHLSGWQFVSSVWRPICSAAVMYLVVRTFGPPAPTSAIATGEAARSLIICIAIGVPVYLFGVLALWFLAGRPRGVESWILERIPEAVQKARSALAGVLARNG